MTEAAALRVRDLHKSFSTGDETVVVLDGISFELRKNEAVAITGPSGSGKSTLLHLLGALDTPTSGTIEIDGASAFDLKEKDLARFRNQTLGFIFQEHHLLPQYTVLENVLLPTLAFPPAPETAEATALELLERVGLSHRLGHRPTQLSGGERQRAAVARALIQSPKVVLCDEPTGNLDRANADAVAKLLFELHRDAGNVLIVVTHNQELAAQFERKLDLADGKLS
ncbi:MAG: ABC transporter ATP-binding protein [Acidobacteria bacterium]|nr:ABC transporter ATP-binding protein [Acidobacteriota bacterium]